MFRPISVLLGTALLVCQPVASFVAPTNSLGRSMLSYQHQQKYSQETTTALYSAAAGLSDAAMWHKNRRREMMQRYGDVIRPMETKSSSQRLAAPLLALANISLLGLSILSGRLPLPQVFLLSLFPGSILSLWQLQILHDNLHGSLWDKSSKRFLSVPKSKLQEATLFWGSLPCVFGYYLYLQFGHLSHHSHVGDAQQASLKQLFASNQTDFEDGDVLFVAHRMKLLGAIGPTFTFGTDKKTNQQRSLTMSLSKSGFDLWKTGRVVRNALAFWASFLVERFMLVINDVVVSITGHNYFFPNKPQEFHETCSRYARVATLLRLSLWKWAGWKSLLFLYLSETLWSLPPHPACAMFVTNHGSSSSTADGSCEPSSSTYAGRWYSLLTLGTNYHCEHHDFPSIPLDQLGRLHEIAPEYYPKSASSANVGSIMYKAFSDPDWYACMKVGVGATA